LGNALALVLVLPAFAAYVMGRLLMGENKAFPGWAQVLSLIPGISGAYLRRAFYSLVFQHCGRGSWIGFGTIFSHPRCFFGRNVYIGCYCCLGEVTLQDDVLIGSNVSIMNGSAQHGTDRLDIPVREQSGVWPHISVGRDTWIGDRAVVMANVGSHCIIGAGAVVTKLIPDFAVVVGNPARIIRFRGKTIHGQDRENSLTFSQTNNAIMEHPS
jgi:acetyltransferase-like isoleucine patch superfamily enzyme